MISNSERQRYSRHLLLGDIGEEGQQRLLRSRVLIVGLGGLGSPVALYLASAGVGQLLIADGDALEVSNLQRQILYDTAGAGEPKAQLAEQRLSALNPDIELNVFDEPLTLDDLNLCIQDVDLVLDCSDNLETRKNVNAVCSREGVPLVSAAAIRWEGHLMVFDFRDGQTPCYECLYPPESTEPVLNCSTSGVVGPVLGVLGSLQALEGMKLLLGLPSAINGQLRIFDGRHHEWRHFAITKRPDCPTCGP